jgi:signal transduction histidine kinase/ActR/RegA family two-component response regulator
MHSTNIALLEEKLRAYESELQGLRSQLLLSQDLLRDISNHISSYSTGIDFYSSLVRYISDKTNLHYVFVGELVESGKEHFAIETIALSAFGNVANNITYPLPGGPCEQVIRGTLYSYPKDCRKTFPKNEVLLQFKVEGYIGYPLFDSSGKAVGLIAVMHENEIEEVSLVESILKLAAKRAEFDFEVKTRVEALHTAQVLLELDRAKTDFFNNISHEFRTPLTLLMGPLDEVLSQFQDDPGQSHTLAKLLMVRRNAQRLQRLVNTLLDFSRIESGRRDAIFQPTDLAEYTTLLAANFRSVIEKAGLKFTVACESTEAIYVNQDMWEKIVLNLVANAFKFTFEGEIKVLLKSRRKKVQLHVCDTGIGISSANLARIFERFVRIQNVRSRTHEGTGIGLALVKELVHMHSGHITVKSKEGEGSIFIVTIPKGKSHVPRESIYEMKESKTVSPLASVYAHEAMNWLSGTSEEIRALSPEDSPSHDRSTILLVDDNADMREYIKSILRVNYNVVTASNGKTALALVSGGIRIDLVLADVMMPEMDGYSLLEEIRKRPETTTLPFILLSGRASEENRTEGIRSGADDYIIKPFSGVELLARVDARIRLASKKRAEQ